MEQGKPRNEELYDLSFSQILFGS